MGTIEGLTVEQRLAKLERIARRWRLASLGLAGCVVCVVGMGAAEDEFPKVVTANSFAVRYEDGSLAGMFGVSDKGQGSMFILIDRDQKSKTVIVPGADGIRVVRADGTASTIE